MPTINPAEFMTDFTKKRITPEVIEESRSELIQEFVDRKCTNPVYGDYAYAVHLFPDAKQPTLPNIVNPPIAIIPDQGPFVGATAQRQNHERRQAQHEEQKQAIQDINECIYYAFGKS